MQEAPVVAAAVSRCVRIYWENCVSTSLTEFCFAEQEHCSPPLPRSRACPYPVFVTPYPSVEVKSMDYIKAFMIGGLFCVIGQLLVDKTKLTPARILVGYVVVGVILGAIGVYKPLAEYAGAGATVPLTGFGYTLAKGVKEAVTQDGFLGIFTGGLKAAAGGITAAIFAGLIASLIFSPKDKS